MNPTHTYRYPGAQPFSTDQEHIFFGRQADIEALHRQVRLEPLVVLYAKSGLGKSSLMNAGLVPAVVRENKYLPIKIRFNAYNPDEEAAAQPLERTQQAIAAASKADISSTYLQKLLPAEQSLWYQLKQAQARSQGKLRLLLLFDQFEELFTYPTTAIQAFKEQLAELLYTQIPQRFRTVVEQEVEQPSILTNEELALLHQPFEVHMVLAIRSDRISLLDRLADRLPTIKRSWYELDALQLEQAEDAILNPAYLQGSFASTFFDYDDEALQKILNFLTQDQSQKIESFQLQILCQAIERKVIQQGLSIVTAADLGNIEEVYENYYSDQIQSIPDLENQLAARRFIEEGLIFEEEERRLSLYEGQIFSHFHLSPEVLRQLEDTHLIRREPSMKGGYTYELSHDTLVAPVLRAKEQRLRAERTAAEQADRLRKEAELRAAQEKAALEKQLRQKAQQNEQRARQRTRMVLIFSVVALLSAGLAGWSYLQAQAEKKRANESDQLAEANAKKLNESQSKVLRAEEELADLEQQQIITKTALEEAASNRKKAIKETEDAQQIIAQLQSEQRAILEETKKSTENLARYQQEEVKAQQALREAEQAIKTARKEAEESQLNARIAEQKLLEITAQLEAQNQIAQSAKNQARKSLAEAQKDILQLQYESALQKIKIADALETAEDAVALAYLELAFWYNELNLFDRAIGILDTAAMAGNKPSLSISLSQLPSKKKLMQEKIRDVIRSFDPTTYQSLQERYYPEMIPIKGGSFTMGCDPTKDVACERDETQHLATIRDFFIAKYETTWWQYNLFCVATNRPYKIPEWGRTGNHPAVNITWKDALIYANWLSQQHGLKRAIKTSIYGLDINSKGFRIPSEAEWEYAAKGGQTRQEYVYSGSNTLDSVGWHFGNSTKGPHAIGLLKANQLGLYDMSGNVWEWCWDRKTDYLPESPVDYYGPEMGSYRILRGGAWSFKEKYSRTSYRYSRNPDIRINTHGFRLARNR